MGERRAPAVQHCGEADPGTEVLRVGRDRDECLGRGLEQDAVDDGLVMVGDIADRRWQREHHVVVGHGQQLGLAVGKPFPRGRTLALRAMPIATGVVGDVRVRALLAARDMPAESRRAAALDGRHDLQLAEAHVTGVGVTPRRSVAAEDVRHLDRRAGQERPRVTRAASSPWRDVRAGS